jgi:hypothetical protein
MIRSAKLEAGEIKTISLFQSGFEQPLKWFFARFEACFFEHASAQAGEWLSLLAQRKPPKKGPPRGRPCGQTLV